MTSGNKPTLQHFHLAIGCQLLEENFEPPSKDRWTTTFKIDRPFICIDSVMCARIQRGENKSGARLGTHVSRAVRHCVPCFADFHELKQF
ncbi:hypothetical protein J6590_073576 [Homalodisca vitripennis]|nr:hypothetical protein J6590_073576 [Homalodisca vitripennis]